MCEYHRKNGKPLSLTRTQHEFAEFLLLHQKDVCKIGDLATPLLAVKDFVRNGVQQGKAGRQSDGGNKGCERPSEKIVWTQPRAKAGKARFASCKGTEDIQCVDQKEGRREAMYQLREDAYTASGAFLPYIYTFMVEV